MNLYHSSLFFELEKSKFIMQHPWRGKIKDPTRFCAPRILVHLNDVIISQISTRKAAFHGIHSLSSGKYNFSFSRSPSKPDQLNQHIQSPIHDIYTRCDWHCLKHWGIRKQKFHKFHFMWHTRHICHLYNFKLFKCAIFRALFRPKFQIRCFYRSHSGWWALHKNHRWKNKKFAPVLSELM